VLCLARISTHVMGSGQHPITRSWGCFRFCLFPRIWDDIPPSQPYLRPIFGDSVLYEHVTGVFGLELTDKTRIPQLAGDAKVFTTRYHGVGLAAF
jgi:hypothetical protein